MTSFIKFQNLSEKKVSISRDSLLFNWKTRPSKHKTLCWLHNEKIYMAIPVLFWAAIKGGKPLGLE